MLEFVPGFLPANDNSDAHYLVLMDDQHLLVGGQLISEHQVSLQQTVWQPIPKSDFRFLGLVPQEQHHIGSYKQYPCYVLRIAPDAQLPPGYRWEPLRVLLQRNLIADSEFALVACGLQVMNWDRAHQYCGQCGNATVPHASERSRVCEACVQTFYPRISPCVIGLITRGERCLLALHQRSKGRFYSPLAGFIEPGESAEGALHREVYEEVRLRVNNLRYFGSQPWPFPGQLMIGFHAEYESGDIQVDGKEIVEAHWFHFRDLPSTPGGGSLSGKLIQHFIAQHLAAEAKSP